MPALAAATIGGSVIGAVGGLFSGKSSQNAAKENYQHRYQWQVQDLKKAGLNPMLAVSQGAPVPQTPAMPDIGADAVRGAEAGSSAVSARTAVKAQRAVTTAAVLKSNQETAESAARTEGFKLDNQIKFNTLSNSARDSQYAWKIMEGQLSEAAARARNLNIDSVLKLQENEQRIKLNPLLLQYQEFVNTAQKLGIPEKEAEAKFWNATGVGGKVAEKIKSLVPSFPKGLFGPR